MTKIISISDEAYDSLKKLKADRSFSEIIIEFVGEKNRNNIMNFAGILTDKEASDIKKKIGEVRKLSSRRFQ